VPASCGSSQPSAVSAALPTEPLTSSYRWILPAEVTGSVKTLLTWELGTSTAQVMNTAIATNWHVAAAHTKA